MDKLLSNKQQALFAVAVTAMPGIQRTLLALLIQFSYGLVSLGQFTNDLSIVFMITHFSAIGWANLVLVRVPLVEGVERLLVIRRLLRFVYPVTGIGIVIIFALSFSTWIFQPVFMISILIGWTGYQLIRHFFISLRKYVVILGIDILCTICMTVLLVAPGVQINPLLAMGMPLLLLTALGGAYLLYRSRDCARITSSTKKDLQMGIELGMTNFLSDGMTLSLGPLANFLGGSVYAGLIGLVTSFVGVILLFPRALAMYHLPGLVQADRRTSAEFLSTFLCYRQVMHRLLLIMGSVVLLLGITGGPFLFPEAVSLNGAWVIFLLLVGHTVVNQMGLPDSSRLMVKEQSHLMLRINSAAFCTFGALAVIICLLPSETSRIMLLLVAQLAISGMRFLLLNTYARRMQYGTGASLTSYAS